MKIQFVCRGNTYRSRLAEAYLKSKQLSDIEVSSSGVEAHKNLNGPITLYAKRLLEQDGILSFAAPTWTTTSKETTDEQDVVVFMHPDVYEEFIELFHTPPHTYRVWEIADIYIRSEDAEREIERHWKEAEATFDRIKMHVDGLIASLRV